MGSPQLPSTLIVDSDPGVRKMVAVLLRRAGFRTYGVNGIDAAPPQVQRRYDVIVRDLAAGSTLDGTPSELLRRTVVLTTAPGGLVQRDAAGAFAVVRKPFDIDALVRIASACARTVSAEHKTPVIGARALRHFVESVPALRTLLSAVPVTPRELLLHAQMRKTILELSTAFYEAAEAESSRSHAAALLAASIMAAELAGRAPKAMMASH